jgi:hypothetical protein
MPFWGFRLFLLFRSLHRPVVLRRIIFIVPFSPMSSERLPVRCLDLPHRRSPPRLYFR